MASTYLDFRAIIRFEWPWDQVTTDCRHLLQQLAFSELCHFSWDMFPTNNMAYDMHQFHHSLAGDGVTWYHSSVTFSVFIFTNELYLLVSKLDELKQIYTKKSMYHFMLFYWLRKPSFSKVVWLFGHCTFDCQTFWASTALANNTPVLHAAWLACEWGNLIPFICDFLGNVH